MSSFRSLLLTWVLVIIASTGWAQSSDQGNWLMYFGTHRLNADWSVHTELQYRNHSLVPTNPEQVLSRVGINRHVSSTTTLTAGYGFIPSYPNPGELGSPATVEHRIWQQLLLVHRDARVKYEHRYRVEQRWVDGDYRNRLRYRFMVTVPLGKTSLEPDTWFVGVYDEIFLNTKRTLFDRNRLYAAVGYKCSDRLSFQAGGLHQETQAGGKFYAQAAVFFTTGSSK